MLLWLVCVPVYIGRADEVLSGRQLLRTVGDKGDDEKLNEFLGKDISPGTTNPDVTEKTATQPRVLRFPNNRSLGRVKVMDADIKRRIQASHYDALDSVGRRDWVDWIEKAEYLGEAQGDVVIPAGKKVALFLYENAFKDLSPLLNLKPDDVYMLSHVQLAWNRNNQLEDKSMSYISHLAGLKELRLYQTTATTEGMEHITNLQSLEMLRPPKGLTDTGLSYVAQLESLKRFYLTENRITNAGLKRYLPKLTELEELTLWSGRMNDAGLACLADLPKLSFLSLRSGNFTDDGLSHVKKCSSLRILDLMHLPITDVGLQHLSGHPRLENLRLYNTEVTDSGLVYLKSMPSLKKLNIGKRGQKDQITDAGMVHLAQIDSLEYLDLPGGITDKGMAHIAELNNLKHLQGGGDSDAVLQHLSKLQSLECLATGGTDFTDAGMDDLAKLTNLKDLRLFFADSISNEGLAKLKTLKSLERLTLSCKNVTIAGLSHLNELPDIVDLKVRNIKYDNSGLDISGLSKLQKLRLTLSHKGNGFVRDEDMACLKKLKHLRRLVFGDISSSVITDAGIAYLKDLPDMRFLFCGSPYLTDKSLCYLANMKTLESLTIAGNFTDDGLCYLEHLTALHHLKIYSANNFNPAALEKLKEKLPNLGSFSAEQNRELVKMPRD